MALRWFVHSACHVVGYPKEPDHHRSSLQQQQQRNSSYPNGGGIQSSKSNGGAGEQLSSGQATSGFQMPLHYPRYTKADYEAMEEWRVDLLLREYGLSFKGTLDEKRAYAMGAFLWPDQY